MPHFGILNIDKPAGISSRRVVNHVQRLVKPAKAGHAGTLDPLATGVLVVCVGWATRLISYVQRMPKHYLGTFLLGRVSTTEDVEGELTMLDSPPQPSLSDLQSACRRLTGTIEQRPPAYSALKVKGRRAYKLARSGQAVELSPRTIIVYSIEVVRYEYPELVLDIRCGSGTYVRSLGRDLAASLATGAVMSALERRAVGSFGIDAALSLDDLTSDALDDAMLPALQAVEDLPRIELDSAQLGEIRHGRMIRCGLELASGDDSSEYAAVDQAGHLVAILTERRAGLLGPLHNFAPPA